MVIRRNTELSLPAATALAQISSRLEGPRLVLRLDGFAETVAKKPGHNLRVPWLGPPVAVSATREPNKTRDDRQDFPVSLLQCRFA